MTRLVNIFWGLRVKDESLASPLRVFNSMSEIPPPLSPKKEVIAPRQESIAEEFADDPPESEPHYGGAKLWLVARDPHCLFAYWEFRAEEHPDAAGHDGRARFFLRIFRDGRAVESSTEIESAAGHAFIPAQSADSGYLAELGFFAGEIWCFLARSGIARTPPALPSADAPAIFATIPARLSLGKMCDLLAKFALPGESLAITAARLQNDARHHGDWTPEHEHLLAEILGASVAEAAASPAESITLTQAIRRKFAATADAAKPGAPLPAPPPGSAPASPGAAWPTSKKSHFLP